jgi:hypothetical protein
MYRATLIIITAVLVATLVPVGMQADASTPPEIVAFGDSITWGAGSGSTLGTGTRGPTGHGRQGDSYPAQLAELTGRTVVNQGGLCETPLKEVQSDGRVE